jgi:hypothetical protein
MSLTPNQWADYTLLIRYRDKLNAEQLKRLQYLRPIVAAIYSKLFKELYREVDLGALVFKHSPFLS